MGFNDWFYGKSNLRPLSFKMNESIKNFTPLEHMLLETVELIAWYFSDENKHVQELQAKRSQIRDMIDEAMIMASGKKEVDSDGTTKMDS